MGDKNVSPQAPDTRTCAFLRMRRELHNAGYLLNQMPARR